MALEKREIQSSSFQDCISLYSRCHGDVKFKSSKICELLIGNVGIKVTKDGYFYKTIKKAQTGSRVKAGNIWKKFLPLRPPDTI